MPPEAEPGFWHCALRAPRRTPGRLRAGYKWAGARERWVKNVLMQRQLPMATFEHGRAKLAFTAQPRRVLHRMVLQVHRCRTRADLRSRNKCAGHGCLQLCQAPRSRGWQWHQLTPTASRGVVALGKAADRDEQRTCGRCGDPPLCGSSGAIEPTCAKLVAARCRLASPCHSRTPLHQQLQQRGGGLPFWEASLSSVAQWQQPLPQEA